ncbi:MAG: Amuc_1099 family pilus-like system protein [Verrucomicrobiota bacterium]
MSWFSTNYEKAALGGAAVIALGFVYLGYAKFGSVSDDFAAVLKGGGQSNAAVKEADLIPKAIASMKLPRIWVPASDGKRSVDLFTGIPLFISSASPDAPIDITGESQPVHPPIANIWWIENRLDPGFGDSPSRDPDGDGFSNLEEYNAKTDPNDPQKFPSLVAKLKYVGDESLAWVVRPGYPSDQGELSFNYLDSQKRENKTGAANQIAPGGLFFEAGVMKGRFKLLGSEVRKEMSERTKAEMEVTIVRIEDQQPNKKGVIYEFPAPLPLQRAGDYTKYDRKAIFSLEALGQEGKEFKVDENMTFGLPSDSPTKNYKVKEVTVDSVTVEYTEGEGEPKSVTITKGNTPSATE